MNAKPEQIQTDSIVDKVAKNTLQGPDATATELTEVTNKELDQVEGGYGIGTRTGDGPSPFFHHR